MNDKKMGYSEALVEWSGGGLDDVPTENMLDMYNELIAEFKKRGYYVRTSDFKVTKYRKLYTDVAVDD